MRRNQDTIVRGRRVVLVPYRVEHVAKYHAWMQSPELRELTASEPLSLIEEYSMQQSWLADDDKCTFIVLSRDRYDETDGDEVAAMVGDVNFFLNDVEHKDRAEIEIMIADPAARGRGLGKEALLAMMNYGVRELSLAQITAKIGYSNEKSLTLFTKLGFVEESRSDAFQEVTLLLSISEDVRKWLMNETQHIVFGADIRLS